MQHRLCIIIIYSIFFLGLAVALCVQATTAVSNTPLQPSSVGFNVFHPEVHDAAGKHWRWRFEDEQRRLDMERGGYGDTLRTWPRLRFDSPHPLRFGPAMPNQCGGGSSC
jgi:hypothetical protein